MNIQERIDVLEKELAELKSKLWTEKDIVPGQVARNYNNKIVIHKMGKQFTFGGREGNPFVTWGSSPCYSILEMEKHLNDFGYEKLGVLKVDF